MSNLNPHQFSKFEPDVALETNKVGGTYPTVFGQHTSHDRITAEDKVFYSEPLDKLYSVGYGKVLNRVRRYKN